MKKTKPKLRVKHFLHEYYVIQERKDGLVSRRWQDVEKPLQFLGSNSPMIFNNYDDACKEAERLLEGDNLQKLKDSLFKKNTTKPIRYFG